MLCRKHLQPKVFSTWWIDAQKRWAMGTPKFESVSYRPRKSSLIWNTNRNMLTANSLSQTPVVDPLGTNRLVPQPNCVALQHNHKQWLRFIFSKLGHEKIEFSYIWVGRPMRHLWITRLIQWPLTNRVAHNRTIDLQCELLYSTNPQALCICQYEKLT